MHVPPKRVILFYYGFAIKFFIWKEDCIMTKITIFSGFLGAGKTTLIKKLIAEAYQNEKLVLIENEFGEIGIDGGFLQDAGVAITEMNSGCICCSLVGDFGAALKKVLETYAPDRVLYRICTKNRLHWMVLQQLSMRRSAKCIKRTSVNSSTTKLNMQAVSFSATRLD